MKTKVKLLRTWIPPTPLVIAVIAIACWFAYVSEIAKHPDKSTELIAMALSTFVAAWAGGWAAFSAEIKRRAEEEERLKKSAANKALYTAFIMHESLKNLCMYSADIHDMRDHSGRALMMNSPQPGMMQPVHFDFGSINYFLDADDDVSAQTLLELQELDWHYAIVLSTVDMRGRAFDELHQLMATNPINNQQTEAIQIIYQLQYDRLTALTDQLIHTVDDGLVKAKKADGSLRTALARQFPNEEFLRVNFEPKPESVLS